MIILDEQLLGRNLEVAIGSWYRGSVRFITDLRPNTVIKDEAIPFLLRQQRQPTLVTINERDFWQRIVIDQRFCAVCFAIADSQADAIPALLRRLLQHPRLRTKTQRMGCVIRMTGTTANYYTWHDRQVRALWL